MSVIKKVVDDATGKYVWSVGTCVTVYYRQAQQSTAQHSAVYIYHLLFSLLVHLFLASFLPLFITIANSSYPHPCPYSYPIIIYYFSQYALYMVESMKAWLTDSSRRHPDSFDTSCLTWSPSFITSNLILVSSTNNHITILSCPVCLFLLLHLYLFLCLFQYLKSCPPSRRISSAALLAWTDKLLV